jgi:hypothetical protein
MCLMFLIWVHMKLTVSISFLSLGIHQNLFLKRPLTMMELLPLPMKYLYMCYILFSSSSSFFTNLLLIIFFGVASVSLAVESSSSGAP